MSNAKAIKDIELNIQEAKYLIEFGNALDRLRNNKDFKLVINKGYFEQESIRLVHLKSDPNMQSESSQLSIVKQMDAIGALNQYFNMAYYRANMAEKAMIADEETRSELAAEDLA
jgi:hypothetical protein